ATGVVYLGAGVIDISVSYLSGTLPSQNDQLVVNFSPLGPVGPTGYTGYTGPSDGPIGPTGPTGPAMQTIKVARTEATVPNGLTTVRLTWDAPFLDDAYSVLIANPPHVPGQPVPVPVNQVYDDPLTGGLADWAVQYGTFASDAGGTCVGSLDPTISCCSMAYAEALAGVPWNVNQYSQVKFAVPSVGDASIMGPALHIHDDVFLGAYVDTTDDAAYIFYRTGVTQTILASTPLPASPPVVLSPGDVLRLAAMDGVLTFYQNSNVLLTVPLDVAILRLGGPGIQGTGYAGGAARIQDWEGGNLTNTINPIQIQSWTYVPTGVGIDVVVDNQNTNPMNVRISAWATAFP
ncbi:MAG: hypothetical protein ABSE66_10120, partial [Thermoplasmata archaeon]